MFTKMKKKSIVALLTMLVMAVSFSVPTVTFSAPEDLADYEYMDDFEYISDYDDFDNSDGDVDFSDYADCEEE